VGAIETTLTITVKPALTLTLALILPSALFTILTLEPRNPLSDTDIET